MGHSNKKESKEGIKKKIITRKNDEVIKFLLALLIITFFVFILYFVSKIIVKKREDANTSNNLNITISYDKVSVGMILNRPYDEYFVMVYDSTTDDAMIYSSLISKYSGKDNSLKVYFCDLSNKLNSDYIAKDKSNKNAKSINELQFGPITLLKVRNGKIVSYIEDIDSIRNTLG